MTEIDYDCLSRLKSLRKKDKGWGGKLKVENSIYNVEAAQEIDGPLLFISAENPATGKLVTCVHDLGDNESMSKWAMQAVVVAALSHRFELLERNRAATKDAKLSTEEEKERQRDKTLRLQQERKEAAMKLKKSMSESIKRNSKVFDKVLEDEKKKKEDRARLANERLDKVKALAKAAKEIASKQRKKEREKELREREEKVRAEYKSKTLSISSSTEDVNPQSLSVSMSKSSTVEKKKLSKQQRKRLFNFLDKKNNEVISLEELKDVIGEFDETNDGAVIGEELEKLTKAVGDQVNRETLLCLLDADEKAYFDKKDSIALDKIQK
eukprot:g1028.t1